MIIFFLTDPAEQQEELQLPQLPAGHNFQHLKDLIRCEEQQ